MAKSSNQTKTESTTKASTIELTAMRRSKFSAFVSPLVSGQKLVKAVDLVTRCCLLAKVVPPALTLYCSRRSHYENIGNGVITLSYDAWNTLYFPSILYHEVAHHLSWALYQCDKHDETFFVILFTMLEKDGYLNDYILSNEYKYGITIGKRLKLIPKEYDYKKYDTLGKFEAKIMAALEENDVPEAIATWQGKPCTWQLPDKEAKS